MTNPFVILSSLEIQGSLTFSTLICLGMEDKCRGDHQVSLWGEESEHH